ncbi:hypothetical protein T484DRAFT_2623008 [Baffinella frigidus]|nr:hypothetical protein T484DRAFT_2623008 [Cryptophyta sp. CCMP2293]
MLFQALFAPALLTKLLSDSQPSDDPQQGPSRYTYSNDGGGYSDGSSQCQYTTAGLFECKMTQPDSEAFPTVTKSNRGPTSALRRPTPDGSKHPLLTSFRENPWNTSVNDVRSDEDKASVSLEPSGVVSLSTFASVRSALTPNPNP